MSSSETPVKTREVYDEQVRDLHPSFRFEANKSFYATMVAGSGTCAAMAMFHAMNLIFDPKGSYNILHLLIDGPFIISVGLCIGFCVVAIIRKDSFRSEKHVTYAFSRHKAHIVSDFMLAAAFPSIAVLVYTTYNLGLSIMNGRQLTGVAVLYAFCAIVLIAAWMRISRLAAAERRQDRQIQDEQREKDAQREHELQRLRDELQQLKAIYNSLSQQAGHQETRQ